MSASSSGNAGPVLAGERVATMLVDASCPKCQYSLKRLPIVREPVYGHHAIRCAECGAVVVVDRSSVEKLSEWAFLRMAGWYLLTVMLIFLMLVRGANFGQGAIGNGTLPYARILAKMHQPEPIVGSVYGRDDTNDEFEVVSTTWFDSLDHHALVRQHGGWRQLIEWRPVLWQWALGFLFLLLASVGITILTCNQARVVRLIWLGMSGFIVADSILRLSPFRGTMPRTPMASVSVFTPELIEKEARLADAIVLLLMVGVLTLVVRPLARSVVRAFAKSDSISEYQGLWPQGRDAVRPARDAFTS